MADINSGFSWAGVSALIAALGALGAAFGFGVKNSKDKGALEQKVKDMENRVNGFDGKLAEIKSCSDEAMSVSKVLSTNIDWIKETLQDIKVSIKELKT